jgi:hypothetical protein
MKLISYFSLVTNEGGINLQRGMNFGIKGSYSILLMSVESNSPYADEMFDDGVIEYEGHDQERIPKKEKKLVDQPMHNKSGSLTQNGKFFEAAWEYKDNKREPAKVKIYRKIKKGQWVDMGFYNLVDSFIVHDGTRNVFKFHLQPNNDGLGIDIPKNIDLLHNRNIPGSVMVEVYNRDKGKCVICGAKDNIHYDHKIPYSKGGSSKTSKNIQLLCAKHNLSKGNKFLY